MADVAALASLFEKLSAAGSAEERSSAVAEVVSAVQAAGEASLAPAAKQVQAAIEDASPAAREGGLLAFSKLVAQFGRKAEPYLVPLVALLLERAADKTPAVRTAAEDAAKALFAILNPYATEDVLPALFDGMHQARNWQTKVLALRLLSGLAKTAPNQIAAALSVIVPNLTGERALACVHSAHSVCVHACLSCDRHTRMCASVPCSSCLHVNACVGGLCALLTLHACTHACAHLCRPTRCATLICHTSRPVPDPAPHALFPPADSMADAKEQVKAATSECLKETFAVNGNRDITKFLPALIGCIARPVGCGAWGGFGYLDCIDMLAGCH